MTAKNRQVLVGPTIALSKGRSVDGSTHPCMRNAYMHQDARCALLRVRMEAWRRATTAKDLVQSDVVPLRPDHLRYGRLRPPSRLSASLRPLTRQGLDCGPRLPKSPTIRAKGKNGLFFKKTLDAAATWKSILCRSKHKRSTRINRAGIAMPSAINPKHLVATNFKRASTNRLTCFGTDGVVSASLMSTMSCK